MANKFGTNSNNFLISDTLVGGSGNDLLDGGGFFIENKSLARGKGEIDTLTGGVGSDRFFLYGGEPGLVFAVYHDDSNSTTAGLNDYALITDFKSSEDNIELLGTKNDYVLGASPSSSPSGTGIFLDKPGTEPNELIAILQGVAPFSLSLSASYFDFVQAS